MSEISRRHMLKTGAMGIAAGIGAGCSEDRQSHEPIQARTIPAIGANEPIRAAFIGVGGRGTGLLDNWLKLEGQQVVAVCDIDSQNLNRAVGKVQEAQGQAPNAVNGDKDSYQQLLDRQDIHVIITATPCFEHARIMKDTIRSGKHIYGEKPLALNVADANMLQRAADANPQLVVQIGFQWMASPRFQETIRRIHQGDIGKLIEGRFFRHNMAPPLLGWFGHRELSGDWMLEQACHEYNIMNWAADTTPLKAYGQGRRDLFRYLQPDRDVTDYYAAIIHFPDDFIVHYTQGWVDPDGFGGFAQKAIGDKGAIEIGGGRISSYRKDYTPEPLTAPTGNDTRFALQAFIDSIRNQTPAVAPVSNGRNATLLALMVRKAVDERREVTWDEMLRTC